MTNRDDLTPEQQASYDASFIGSVERLDREVQALKRAIYDALPYPLRRVVIVLICRIKGHDWDHFSLTNAKTGQREYFICCMRCEKTRQV